MSPDIPAANAARPLRNILPVVSLLCLILLSLWISVEVIVQVPQLQEGAEVRGSAVSPEAMRKELETVKTNLELPQQDTSGFRRSHPVQPVVKLLASYGIEVPVHAEADVPSWLYGERTVASASRKDLNDRTRRILERAGAVVELPMHARADLYRTVLRLRNDAEFTKTRLLERAAQLYRSEVGNSGSGDDAREFFNRMLRWYYEQASNVDRNYDGCVSEIAGYESELTSLASQWAKKLAESTISGEEPDPPSLGIPVGVFKACSRAAVQQDPRDAPPTLASSTSNGWGLLAYTLGSAFKRLDVVLIMGMLALGVLGASASQMIRAEPGARTDTLLSGDMAGVLVRGVTATLVVYLGVSCGLIVFATGDTKANPYALLLACFVASVFSESVWAWARDLVGEKLSRHRPAPAAGKSDSPGK